MESWFYGAGEEERKRRKEKVEEEIFDSILTSSVIGQASVQGGG